MTEPTSALRSTLLLACAFACTATWAQSAPQSAAAASAAERAQRETDRTMYWIRVLATKPAPAKAPAAPVAAAPAPAAPAPRTAVAAAAPAPAPKPAAEARTKVAAAPAANATPAPTKVAMASIPTSSTVSDATYPSALSSSSADHAAVALPPVAAPQPEAPAEPDPGLIQIKSVQPDFPGVVVKRVRKGNVEVHFEVEPNGTVSDAVVVDSSNHRLNDAAIEAIKQWRFKPTPMSHTAAVNLVFDIDKE